MFSTLWLPHHPFRLRFPITICYCQHSISFPSILIKSHQPFTMPKLAFSQSLPLPQTPVLTHHVTSNHLKFRSSHPTQPHRSILMTTTTPSPSPNKSTNSTSTSTLSPQLHHFLSRAQEGNPILGLSRAEAAFSRLKSRNTTPITPPQIVTIESSPLLPSSVTPDFDILIAGGTLGIFYATALQAAGWRVAVIERGVLAGRTQEWNISRHELHALVDANVLTSQQLEQAVVTECTVPGRIGFATEKDTPVPELRVGGVLNVGVAPDVLVREAAQNFRNFGGVVLDQHAVTEVKVAPDTVRLALRKQQKQAVGGALGAGGTGIVSGAEEEEEDVIVSARVLVDAMGSFSPIAEQIRGGKKPDGVCITVGSCMKGPWQKNDSPDLIYSFQPINTERSTQYFWEAFPVQREENCRTTYMFAYGPCEERRQTLTQALEDYVEMVGKYQGVNLEDCEVKRVLFGFFPSYHKDSPTAVAFDRILPVGDAGGLQSPISFGGFGCCLRHLQRIQTGLSEALSVKDDSLLSRKELQRMQSYLPSLSVTGLFHTAMSVQPGQSKVGPFLGQNGINEILWSNMKSMEKLGVEVQRPFLQDVVTAGGLSKTLAMMAITNPLLALKMTAFIGPIELLGWSRHYLSLVGFATILPLARFFQNVFEDKSVLDDTQRYRFNRFVDMMTYGTGADATEDK